MTQRVAVTERYLVEFDGSIEDYVTMADRMAVGGLAEKDAGDATGLYVSEYQRRQPEDDVLILRAPSTVGQWSDLNILVTVTAEQEFFIWDPPL